MKLKLTLHVLSVVFLITVCWPCVRLSPDLLQVDAVDCDVSDLLENMQRRARITAASAGAATGGAEEGGGGGGIGSVSSSSTSSKRSVSVEDVESLECSRIAALSSGGVEVSSRGYKRRGRGIGIRLNLSQDDRCHRCPYCPYVTMMKTNLNNHVRTHTGEKPYPCPYCSMSFSQKGSLQTHIRTHTGEKPFACTFCSYRSAQKSTLNNHVWTHYK